MTGWWFQPTPLKNDGVRQLVFIFYSHGKSYNSMVPVTTKQLFFGAQKVLATKVPALHLICSKQTETIRNLSKTACRTCYIELSILWSFFRWWQWWSQERLLRWSIEKPRRDPQVIETGEVPICSYIQYIGSLYHVYLYYIYLYYIYIYYI